MANWLATIGLTLMSGWLGYCIGSRWPSKVLRNSSERRNDA